MLHSGPPGRKVTSIAGAGERSLIQMMLYYLGLFIFNVGFQKANCLLMNDK